jgi:predicted phage baseplate assembly protein
VELRVAEQAWTRVDDLRGQEPTASVFAVEVTPEGGAGLRFGDGREGAVVPAQARLSIRYRLGVGEDGNRLGGAIADLAGADPAIVSTFNPLPTSGGVEPEAPGLAKTKAMAGIHSLDRAISVADVRSLALTFGGVRRASVFQDPVRRREHLTVVVSGERGEALTDDERQALHTFLINRMPPGASVTIANRTTVPIRARLQLHIEPGSDPIAVIRAVRLRLGLDDPGDGAPGLLHPDRVDLGRDVQLSDLYGALDGVANLSSVFVDLLYRADAAPARSDRISMAPRELPVWAAPSDSVEPLEIRWEEARDL